MEKFIESLVRALESQGRKVAAIPVAGALKSEEEIDTLIAPFMGEEDSIFGRMTDLLLIDFFDRAALQRLTPDAEADITILYGCGAALADWKAPLVYVDRQERTSVPHGGRSGLQRRARHAAWTPGSPTNAVISSTGRSSTPTRGR